jgi:hypothetical protein
LDKYPDLKLIDLSNQERADEWVHIQKAVKKRNKKSTAPLFRRGDLFFPPLAPIDMPNLEDNND